MEAGMVSQINPGMTVDFDQVRDTTTGRPSGIYRRATATWRSTHLRYGPGKAAPSLVLTDHSGRAPDRDPAKLDQAGIRHVSLVMPDVKALAGQLMGLGVDLAASPEAFAGPGGKVAVS